MQLIDGIGQLGESLKKIVKDDDVIIYHTWNFIDRSKETQKKCHEELKKFVDNNKDKKIIFISTILNDDSYYSFYKRMSELQVLEYSQNICIRLPTLIGKGVCEKFRNGELTPFDEMELMTIDEATNKIVELIGSNERITTIKGDIVSAKLAKALILYGKTGGKK